MNRPPLDNPAAVFFYASMNSDQKSISKFLSYVLRHDPQSIGLRLDPQGWADIDELLIRAGRPLTQEQILRVVATNDKQRFALSPDGSRIRANQGHSIDVDLNLPPAAPPETLYHGTSIDALPMIRAQGLQPRSRQHVHLSLDTETAQKVGQRHGKPAVLTVASGAMHRDGHVFFQAENGVWLSAHIPAQHLSFPA